MKRALLLFSLLFLLSTAGLRAQDTLGICAGGQIYNLQSFAYYTDTASFYIWVKNYSSSPYQGTITLATVVDSMSGPPPDTAQIDSIFVQLSPGDSFPLVITETFTPLDYRVGGNIVVIWPSATNAYFFNIPSQPDTVTILGYNSVGEHGNSMTTVFPVPFRNHIFINTAPGRDRPDRIRIIDLSGKVIYEEKFSPVIQMSPNLHAGTYILEMQWNSGRVERKRLVRSE